MGILDRKMLSFPGNFDQKQAVWLSKVACLKAESAKGTPYVQCTRYCVRFLNPMWIIIV